MYQKYVNGMPLYRQEKDWEQLGLALSRATMANWIIRCSQDWLAPVADLLKKELLKRDIVHCDETTVQVLKEEGKEPQTKLYMWLYRTGRDDKPPIILYDYQPSRGGKNAADYLKRFHGYLHTDGYAGYEKVEVAENSIRPFVVGRKNWLFSDTPKGADASAIVYSIIETAKANNLNVYTYLNYLLLYMPGLDYQNDPELMDDMMPWSERVQSECRKS